jgi:Photosynthetic reaction centre cytochrome C subunit.
MKKKLTVLVLALIFSGITLSTVLAGNDFLLSSAESGAGLTQDKSVATEKTAEQVYKNIQVFKGIPASQLEKDMAFITGSLGVRCNYCHVNPFEKDDKATKLTARKMIQMVFELNKGSFNGAGAVSCYTCHRGKPSPVSVPALGLNLWLPINQPTKTEAPLPTLEQVLDRYVEAVGGRQALERITSRVLKGSRIGADGVLVPEEVQAKAPDKLLIIISYPNNVFRTGFNGLQGWAKTNQEQREATGEMLAELKHEAEFYKETRMKEQYSKMRVAGKANVGDREAYIIEATPNDGGNMQKLYFDTQTGLLVRKYAESKIALGQAPTQIDYEDYREVDGVKLPFMIRWSIPGRVWGRKIDEVKQNVTLDDARFNVPAASK